MPPDCLLSGVPLIELSGQDVTRIMLGQAIRWEGQALPRCRLSGPEGFVGLGEISGDGWLHPRRLLATVSAAVCLGGFNDQVQKVKRDDA